MTSVLNATAVCSLWRSWSLLRRPITNGVSDALTVAVYSGTATPTGWPKNGTIFVQWLNFVKY